MIGPNSPSPAYSPAVVIGPIVALVGVAAPGILLASFVVTGLALMLLWRRLDARSWEERPSVVSPELVSGRTKEDRR